jgi:hypothetical protein
MLRTFSGPSGRVGGKDMRMRPAGWKSVAALSLLLFPILAMAAKDPADYPLKFKSCGRCGELITFVTANTRLPDRGMS